MNTYLYMMKKILAVAFATIPLWAAAQQALWEGGKPVSPQINEDKTVTFRIYAPNAKEVKVTGDFLPTEKVTTPMGEIEAPGSAELSMHEGVWEFTTPEPLLPELYSYTFIVDGLKINDPSNVYLLRDISSLTNIFLIDGERASNYAVNEVPHGTVSKVWYDSPKLGSNRRMTVYTPAGYEDSDRSYPVLYLLHGMGGDEVSSTGTIVPYQRKAAEPLQDSRWEASIPYTYRRSILICSTTSDCFRQPYCPTKQ